jgi:hypothetical protein
MLYGAASIHGGNAVRLTNAIIASIQAPPKGKRVELKDEASPGLS